MKRPIGSAPISTAVDRRGRFKDPAMRALDERRDELLVGKREPSGGRGEAVLDAVLVGDPEVTAALLEVMSDGMNVGMRAQRGRQEGGRTARSSVREATESLAASYNAFANTHTELSGRDLREAWRASLPHAVAELLPPSDKALKRRIARGRAYRRN
jgi:hypothetical protein